MTETRLHSTLPRLRLNPSLTSEATASFAPGCMQRYRVFTVTLANKQHYRAVRSLRHSTLPRLRVNPEFTNALAVAPRSQPSYRLFARYGTQSYRFLPSVHSGLHSPLPRFKQMSWVSKVNDDPTGRRLAANQVGLLGQAACEDQRGQLKVFDRTVGREADIDQVGLLGQAARLLEAFLVEEVSELDVERFVVEAAPGIDDQVSDLAYFIEVIRRDAS
jgi:hypothetical protein